MMDLSHSLHTILPQIGDKYINFIEFSLLPFTHDMDKILHK